MYSRMDSLEQKLFNTELDFSAVTKEYIQELVQDIKELHQNTYDKIGLLSHTPQNINHQTAIQPLLNLNIYIDKALTLCTFLKNVHLDSEIRDICTSAETEITAFQITCSLRTDVFDVCRQYELGAYCQEKSRLHAEELRHFEDMMRTYKRDGLHITDSALKSHISDIKKKISEISIKFMHNVDESSNTFELSRTELDGLQEDWLSERLTSTGLYKVTLKYDDLIPILDYAKNSTTRMKIYKEFESRCETENLPLLKELLSLKYQLAKLMGYQSHAAFIAENRMIGNSETVTAFLHDMNQRFTPLLQKNLHDLTQYARRIENNDTLNLNIPDMRYYMRLREEELCDINMEEIEMFFPQEKVIRGTLNIYEKLLGLVFVENNNAKAWHTEVKGDTKISHVKYYDVYNNTMDGPGEQIGGFYLDLHPRDGKYAHAAAFELQKGCDISHITNRIGDRQIVIAAMVCNFPENSNLPFDDVETFFHEFGHIMHFICCKTKLACHSSIYTETDFVEAPSQMLENWCYESKALEMLSEHCETKQPLPQEIAQKLKNKSQIHAGYYYKRQLSFACFDFNVHSLSGDELANLDLKKYFNELRATILQLPDLNTCFPAAFDHMVSEYDAGYYGYMLSKSYATDMYETIFQADPLSPEAGKRYRDTILQPGSSKDGMDMIINFLDRKPDGSAFLRSCGLSEANDQKRKRSTLGLFDEVLTLNLPKRPAVETKLTM